MTTINKQMIDVVIVNWNSWEQLQKCLDSLVPQQQYGISSITVINNSLDEACAALCGKYPMVNLLSPSENLGFGGGCNYGAQMGLSPFILFLNPDVYFPSGALHKLTEELNLPGLSQEIGIIGVQLLNPDGSIQENIARFPQFWALFSRMIGLDRLFPKVFLPHYQKDLDYSISQIVDQVPGAFLLVRRSAFDAIKGFDEDFFMYYEDVDFCYRAHKAGWKTLYQPRVQVVHIGGGTTDPIKATRLFYSLRSKVLYVRKHFGKIQMLIALLGIYLLELPGRLLNSMIKLNYKKIAETFKAYLMLTGYYLGIGNRV